MKLWQKTVQVDRLVDEFTVGRDREMDMNLARADILGSLAHTQMLERVGLLSSDELQAVQRGLKEILKSVESGEFVIEDGVEDIHSQVELQLTSMIGAVGGKIHSGRSRNDQVLVDLKIFLRSELHAIVEQCKTFFDTLQELSQKYKDVLMPGYTHLQIAMPSSFGLWLGGYAESLVDDCHTLLAAYKICNKNPLGSAAGYGSSFALDRALTTELLGFDELNYNSIYAQMSRTKCEKSIAVALASLASTLGRFAMDNCMFMSQNFGFISYPDSYTTGSSIMPHKKNPDVWELIRGKCNMIQGVPNTITLLTCNLPLGYNRDMQLLKEPLFGAIFELKGVLNMANVMLQEIVVKRDVVESSLYDHLFSVESVNELVAQGVPFREAYRTVGLEIERGDYTPKREVAHTHQGSIGMLCNDSIREMFESVVGEFNFQRYITAENNLVNGVSNK
ncbi:MAG: argininosuccinate lyase [Rikenellaceae bacterium]